MTDSRGFRAPGTTTMVVSSLIAAVAAYLFNVLGGRVLGEVRFAPIAVLWTAFFIIATVGLVPVEQYATRVVAAGGKVLQRRTLRPAITAGLGSAAAAALFVTVTLDASFDGDWRYVPITAFMLIAYGWYALGKGILAGSRRFASVGYALLGESVGRLVLAGIFLALVRAPLSMAWAMALGNLTVMGLRFWRYDVGQASPPPKGGGFLGAYIGGSAASQVLLAGAPLGVLALGGPPELISIVFATFTLFRAPLTLIYSLQGRLLPFLVRMAQEGDRRRMNTLVWRIAGGGAVLSVLGAGAGWTVGPTIVAVLFGEGFRPDPAVAALAASGVVAASTAQVIGQVLVARGRTGVLASAWISGLVLALLVMWGAPWGIGVRVAAGFAIGELAALGRMTHGGLQHHLKPVEQSTDI